MHNLLKVFFHTGFIIAGIVLGFSSPGMPSQDAAVIAKAQRYMKAGKCSKAVSILKEHLASSGKDSPEVFLELGNAYALCGKPGLAYRAYKSGFERDPGNFSLCKGAAQMAWEIRSFVDAGKYFEQCARITKRKSERSQMFFLAASAFRKAGLPKKAFNIASVWVRNTRSPSVNWLKLYMDLALQLKFFNDARKSALTLVDINPLEETPWVVLAYIAREKGDATEMAAAFEVLTRLKNTENYQHDLFKIYRSLGICRHCTELYGSINESGNSPDFFKKLISCKLCAGGPESALKFIEDTVKETNISGFLLEKARILIRLRRFNDTTRVLREVIEKDSMNLRAYLLMSIVSVHLGDWKSAEHALERAHVLCNNNSSTDRKLCVQVHTLYRVTSRYFTEAGTGFEPVAGALD